MERLTYLDSFGEPCYRLNNTVYKNEVSFRLAEYENTGLTPKEINRMVKEMEAKRNLCSHEKCGNKVLENMDLLAAYKAGKVVHYLPGDTVYDCFGMAWTVTSSEIHRFGDGPLRYLYRCGHPGTDDYCALYSEEIFALQESERITDEKRNIL